VITSTLTPSHPQGVRSLHVAIIMDGNGRWAARRGLPRTAGHRAGASAVRRTVSAAAAQRIGTLTLYAFSADNWRRPAAEVGQLMRLLRAHLHREAERCVREGVRVSVIGRRDRLAADLVTAIESIERETREGPRLHLQFAIDYSGRDAILEAARRHRIQGALPPPDSSLVESSLAAPTLSREGFGRLIAEAIHASTPVPEVDLLIRTGGEQRLSDFLLWECAYAELLFTPCLWPDFAEADLVRALGEFQGRHRRFGGVPQAPRSDPGRAGTPAASALDRRVQGARAHG